MFGSPEWALAINHPIRAEQPSEHGGERGLRLKLREDSMETEFSLALQGPKACNKLPSKHAAKGFDRQKEAVRCWDPSTMIGSQSSGRYDAVNMRVVQ